MELCCEAFMRRHGPSRTSASNACSSVYQTQRCSHVCSFPPLSPQERLQAAKSEEKGRFPVRCGRMVHRPSPHQHLAEGAGRMGEGARRLPRCSCRGRRSPRDLRGAEAARQATRRRGRGGAAHMRETICWLLKGFKGQSNSDHGQGPKESRVPAAQPRRSPSRKAAYHARKEAAAPRTAR
jgi:hypothetical protein